LINPIFKPGPIEPRYSEYLVFEGISVDEFTGKQYYLDAHVAYRRACLNAIEYFKKFGYTGEQIYLLLGSARSRVGYGIVDIRTLVARSLSRLQSSSATFFRHRFAVLIT